jgi:hypothetical protein
MLNNLCQDSEGYHVMFYMQKNPKGAKHSGYRGEMVDSSPNEERFITQEVVDNFNDEDQHALASSIALLAGLFENNGEVSESVANTLRLLSKHPSAMLFELLEQNDTRARAAVIRMLSLPSLNSLPPEQFLYVEGWMHEHPEDAWRWAMALENINVEFPWTEDEFTDEELEQLVEIWNDIVELPKSTFVAKYASDADEAWMEMHGRIPRIGTLRELEPQTIASISLRDLMAAIKSPQLEQMNDELAAKGAAGLANVFGSRWNDWIKAMARQKVNAHDAIYWLPTIPSPGLDEFLFQNRNRPIETLSMIAGAWNDIPPDLIEEGVEAAKSFVQAREYENVKVPGLARIAARYGYDPYDYAKIEEDWLRLLKKGDTIPDIVVEHNGFKMYKLDPDDPRGIFLGKIVTCCQAPGEAGSGAAWYGHSHPDSAFYVFENEDGRILAEAWVWQNDGYYVFDNWEGKGIVSTKTRDTLLAMFQLVADKMVQDHGAVEVRVGGTTDYDASPIPLPWTTARDENENPRPVTLPYDLMFNQYYTNGEGGYTDCAEYQCVVAQAEDAPPCYEPSDATNESVTAGLRQVLSLSRKELENRVVAWKYSQAMIQNILSSNVFAKFQTEGKILPIDYDWDGFDGALGLSGKVALFVGAGIVLEFEETFRALFEPETNSFEIERIGFLFHSLTYVDIIDYFYNGIRTLEENGYPEVSSYPAVEDEPPFYNDIDIPSPFEEPPIELGIEPEDADYALYVEKSNVGRLIQDRSGDMVFYYENKKQLQDAISVYFPINHLLNRKNEAILVKSHPGVVTPVRIGDRRGWGEWIEDELLSENLLRGDMV